jgi:hypothetical protein
MEAEGGSAPAAALRDVSRIQALQAAASSEEQNLLMI